MAVPIMAFMVMMMNQITAFIQPTLSLSRVKAKEVLLQAAARTEKKPAKTAIKGILGRFSGRMSYRFLP